MKPTMTFMQACKDFFGLQDGQTPMQFAKEVKQLTSEDRAEISIGLEKNGYFIVQATAI